MAPTPVASNAVRPSVSNASLPSVPESDVTTITSSTLPLNDNRLTTAETVVPSSPLGHASSGSISPSVSPATTTAPRRNTGTRASLLSPSALIAATSPLLNARQARKASADIDRQLREEKKREDECIKLLFLGTAESGKSTCLKQMKLIHNGNIVDKDHHGKVLDSATAALNGDTRPGAGMMDSQAWANVLRTNLFDSLEKILNNVRRHSTGFQSTAATSAAETLQGIIGPLRDNVLAPPPDLNELIATLLADPSTQTTISNGAKYYLLDSAPRLLQDSALILAPTFVPTNEHILLARLPTSTITETRLIIDGFRFKIYDVNGAHGRRQAWMPFFDFCTAVIYVSAISQYDQPLPEDPTITRLHDSLMVFETVINHPLMAKPAFVLFLNKIDVLKQKLDRGIPVKSTFPDYQGTAQQEYEEVCTFFARKFALAIEDKKRKVYIHFTWATSTSQIKTVLKIVQGVIIKLNLAKADLI